MKDIFGYRLGETFYFAHVNETEQADIYKYRNSAYSKRCLKRSQMFLNLANCLGYDEGKYDKHLNYKYLVLGE
ncbi:MAG: hypothetical protein AAF316_10455 [Cyanobacteria bacterium P01_A01_bin.80]